MADSTVGQTARDRELLKEQVHQKALQHDAESDACRTPRLEIKMRQGRELEHHRAMLKVCYDHQKKHAQAGGCSTPPDFQGRARTRACALGSWSPGRACSEHWCAGRIEYCQHGCGRFPVQPYHRRPHENAAL